VCGVRDFFFRRSYPIDDFDTRTAPIILLYCLKKKVLFLLPPPAVVRSIVVWQYPRDYICSVLLLPCSRHCGRMIFFLHVIIVIRLNIYRPKFRVQKTEPLVQKKNNFKNQRVQCAAAQRRPLLQEIV